MQTRWFGHRSRIVGVISLALSAMLWLSVTVWYGSQIRGSREQHLNHQASSMAFELGERLDRAHVTAQGLSAATGLGVRIQEHFSGDEQAMQFVAERFEIDRSSEGFDSVYLLSAEGAVLVAAEEHPGLHYDAALDMLFAVPLSELEYVDYPDRVDEGGHLIVGFSYPLSSAGDHGVVARLVAFYDLGEHIETRIDSGVLTGKETMRLEDTSGAVVWGEIPEEPEVSAAVPLEGDSGWVTVFSESRGSAMRPAWLVSGLVGLLSLSGTMVAMLLVAGTERAQRQAGVERAARERVQRVLDAEEQFIASMSHEFRTPLNSMIGFSHIMLRGDAGDLTDEQKRQVGMIRNSSQRLLTLVNGLLDFSRMRSGHVDIAPETIPIAGIVSTIEELFAPLIAEKDLEPRFTVAGENPAITTDRELLERALINLVGNAVKFTDHGFVGLHASKLDQHVAFVVTDSGRGIPADQIDVITQEFRRIPGSDPTVPGTGLGVPITREIAALLGGRLIIESHEGQGSAFTLEIPETPPGIGG